MVINIPDVNSSVLKVFASEVVQVVSRFANVSQEANNTFLVEGRAHRAALTVRSGFQVERASLPLDGGTYFLSFPERENLTVEVVCDPGPCPPPEL